MKNVMLKITPNGIKLLYKICTFVNLLIIIIFVRNSLVFQLMPICSLFNVCPSIEKKKN